MAEETKKENNSKFLSFHLFLKVWKIKINMTQLVARLINIQLINNKEKALIFIDKFIKVIKVIKTNSKTSIYTLDIIWV